MKTLFVIPGHKFGEMDQQFLLADIETGEILASHTCSSEYFAKGDLFEHRPERKEKLKKFYNDDIEVKFFREQDTITSKEFNALNRKFEKANPNNTNY